MHNFYKISFIAAIALFFASCHNDVPELPTPEEVAKYEFCKYIDKDGKEQCKSIYIIRKDDCAEVGGTIFCNEKCEETEPCE